MTSQRHRAAAITLRSRYRLVTTGRIAPDGRQIWGWQIWPALAAEHDRRAARIEIELAATSELAAVPEPLNQPRRPSC